MLTEQLRRGAPLVPFYRSALVGGWETRVALRLAGRNESVSFTHYFAFHFMFTFYKFTNSSLNYK